jgi:hypothetical protein
MYIILYTVCYTILISGDYIKTVYSPIEQKGKITESTSDNSEKWFDFIFTMVAVHVSISISIPKKIARF